MQQMQNISAANSFEEVLQPTSITSIKQEMITAREKVFALILRFRQFEDESESVKAINSSDVGFRRFVVTESISRSWRVAEALDTGMIGINVGSLSACESPFGGMKESGYELESGAAGIKSRIAAHELLSHAGSSKFTIMHCPKIIRRSR
ncbi:hypothetical protein K456DRAFT_32777 [Colletotrichum gloeosporioides 23]|nr:hypothetical protein K456DRAFT_32777 [Colletotrichum gloeosporioides 23]